MAPRDPKVLVFGPHWSRDLNTQIWRLLPLLVPFFEWIPPKLLPLANHIFLAYIAAMSKRWKRLQDFNVATCEATTVVCRCLKCEWTNTPRRRPRRVDAPSAFWRERIAFGCLRMFPVSGYLSWNLFRGFETKWNFPALNMSTQNKCKDYTPRNKSTTLPQSMSKNMWILLHVVVATHTSPRTHRQWKSFSIYPR